MTTNMALAVTVGFLGLCAGSKSVAEQQPMPGTVVHAPGTPQALTFDAGGTTPNSARILTSGSQTKGEWSLIELTEMPGSKTAWHRHTFDQAYYVREGVVTFKADEKSYDLPAGATFSFRAVRRTDTPTSARRRYASC